MDHRIELRLIVELASIGNARRTSQLLGISQSTLSEAITRIEAAYGAPLFVRDQRGSRTTEFGAVLVEAATRSLAALDGAEREINLMKSFEQGRLSIGAHPLLIEPYVAPAVARIMQQYPKLEFRIHGDDPNKLVRELRDRQIDFYIGFEPDGPLTGLLVEQVDVPEFVVYCRSGHPLASLPPQGIRVLRDYPIIDWHMPKWFYEQFGPALLKKQETVEGLIAGITRVELSDSGAIRSLVLQTDTLAVAAYETIRADVEAGLFATLWLPDDEGKLMRPTATLIATLEARLLPSVAPLVIAELKRVIAEAGPNPKP
jgi:DNA-binding transcriptional LysR family regulator